MMRDPSTIKLAYPKTLTLVQDDLKLLRALCAGLADRMFGGKLMVANGHMFPIDGLPDYPMPARGLVEGQEYGDGQLHVHARVIRAGLPVRVIEVICRQNITDDWEVGAYAVDEFA